MSLWGTRDPVVERQLVGHLFFGRPTSAAVDGRLVEERLEDFHAPSSRSRARAALFAMATCELREAFAAVPFLFVKGALTDPWLFGGRGQRGASDIDVLVGDLAGAERALASLGYRRRYRGAPARLEARKHERSFVHASFPSVDLHTALLATDAFVDLSARHLARRTKVATSIGAMPCLEVHDMIVHYAGNIASGRATGLVHALVDVRAILAACGVDWSIVRRRARDARCSTGLYALLRASEVLLGASFDAATQTRVRPRGPRGRWIDRLLSLEGGPLRAREPFGMLLFDWPLSDSPALPARRALRVLKSRWAV